MWDPSGAGIKHVSPAFGGQFFTSEPPRKSLKAFYFSASYFSLCEGTCVSTPSNPVTAMLTTLLCLIPCLALSGARGTQPALVGQQAGLCEPQVLDSSPCCCTDPLMWTELYPSNSVSNLSFLSDWLSGKTMKAGPGVTEVIGRCPKTQSWCPCKNRGTPGRHMEKSLGEASQDTGICKPSREASGGTRPASPGPRASACVALKTPPVG